MIKTKPIVQAKKEASFFSNLKTEMELFHEQLSRGEGLEVIAICYGGGEVSVERVIPLPPDMLVCECRNGDRIVMHISSVQLRFHRTFSNTEYVPDEKVPIGFRTMEGHDEIAARERKEQVS